MNELFTGVKYKVRKVIDKDIDENLYLVKVFNDFSLFSPEEFRLIGYRLISDLEFHGDAALDVYYEWRDSQNNN